MTTSEGKNVTALLDLEIEKDNKKSSTLHSLLGFRLNDH